MSRGARPVRRQEVDHRAWLQLVDTDGPFLSVPVLKRAFPAGFTCRWDDELKASFRAEKVAFEKAWDEANRVGAGGAFETARDRWVHFVLAEAFGWGDLLVADDGVRVLSPTHRQQVTSTFSLSRLGQRHALVLVVDPVANLRDIGTDGWAVDQVDRLELLLREASVDVGVVTDGRWWGLVSVAGGRSVASGIVDSQTWVEEPQTRDAFVELLHPQRIAGGRPDQRLAQLFVDSVASAEEITESLGAQVRGATELLVQAFAESSQQARRAGLPDPLPGDGGLVYSAAVTVMMRVVFLLFAEERGLLPTGELFNQAHGLSGEFDRLEARATEEGADALDTTVATWHRLLATSRALYQGASFEDLRLPAYGGSLFDPSRFVFLDAVTPQGQLAVRVPDRVMLEVLRSVQFTHTRGDSRRISFRDIDVEQIGYIYEGLLGYSVERIDEVRLGLKGTAGAEPEVPLSVLAELAEQAGDDKQLARAIRGWLKEHQPSAKAPSEAQLAKQLAAGDQPDAAAEVALMSVIPDDEALRDEVRTWLGAIRADLRGRPTVFLPGGLVVVETPSRRTAGAHYTPRSLAEEVVLHALEPLVYSPGPYQTPDSDQWRLKPHEEILALKVADIACGSGAFLVAAARYLAARVVEAWAQEGLDQGSAEAQRVEATRLVVAQCLYGADINAMAVEMCKLSLWLVSLDPRLPFSFVDDKVLVGNSLLGVTSIDQVRRLHVDPAHVASQPMLSDVEALQNVDALVARATRLRREIATPVDDAERTRSTANKKRQLAQFHEITAQLRDLADGVVAAGLRLGGAPGKQLDAAYEGLRMAVADAYSTDALLDRTALEQILADGLTPTVTTDYERWQPLHWAVELPDVFEQGGFDAVIGNPPFYGGQKLSGAMGSSVRDWLVNVLAGGVKGSADLVAYFFLRAQELAKPQGTLGLIATNTIAQGDTREVGLDQLVERGLTITRAIQSRKWPVSTASTEFSAVWGTFGPVAEACERVADGVPVRRITTLLEPQGRVAGRPVRLAENMGMSFQGCIVLGKGFVLEPEEAAEWIAADPRNAEVLFPYLNGEDLNSRPDASPSRWVIDFNQMTEEDAASFPLPWQRLETTVRAERARKPKAVAASPWWRFLRERPAMRTAIADLDEFIVLAQVSNTLQPHLSPSRVVPSHKIVAFGSDSPALLAILASSIHYVWARKYSSSMRTDLSYSPSDVFLTLPRPAETPELDRLGRTLDTERREMMLRRQLGLTKLYNLVNDPDITGDPDIDRLREIHVHIDRAVMDAYGWGDIPLDHGFHTYRQMTRWTVSPAARVEILDRLLEENHRRAAQQGDAPVADDEDTDEEGSDA